MSLLTEREREAILTRLTVKARSDFLTYCLLFNPPGDSNIFLSKCHLRLIQLVQDIADGQASNRHAVSMPPQHGKAVAVSTPVLTSEGWKCHGNLSVGDHVFHPSGKLVRVTDFIPQVEPCSLEVELSTGEKIKAHPNHEWTLIIDRSRVTVETKQLLRSPLWQETYQLPTVSPLQTPNVDVPVDPCSFPVYVVSVRQLSPEEYEEGNCITVDSDDGLYLVGKTLQPTHNSKFLTLEATSWLMGRRAGLKAAIASFSHDLVVDFSVQIKDRVKSSLYQLIFPDSLIDERIDRLDDWRMSNGSSLLARSCGRKLTGRRIDWLMIDDPHAGREEAESASQRRKVLRWYFADCVSRLSPEAVVFIVATRWHPEDLIGSLTNPEYLKQLESEGVAETYQVINMPAMAFDVNDPIGRQIGEPLFPEVRGLAFLKQVKASIPAYEWESQYQGRPQPSSSGMVDTSKIIYLDRDDEVPDGLVYIRGYDLALTEKEKSDYTATALIGFQPSTNAVYLMEVQRWKLSWAKMKAVMLAKAEEEENVAIAIESVGGFKVSYAEIKEALKGKRTVLKSHYKGDKLVRANRWLPTMEANSFYIRYGDWVKDFLQELDVFPNGAHDDQVDAVSVAFDTYRFVSRSKVKTKPNTFRRPWLRTTRISR